MIAWQFLYDGRCPARSTIQKDINLFKEVRRGTVPGAFRIYNWSEPALTIGFHQKSFVFFDETLSIPIVKRPTGGGAVLHFDDITFSISAPARGALSGTILETSRNVTALFQESLKGCGLNTHIQDMGHQYSPICFARPSPVELMIGENKLMGIALAKKGGFILIQGVIPLRVDHVLSERVFGKGAQQPMKGIFDYKSDFSEKLFFNSLCKGFISHVDVLLHEGN
jgi:lipoate-protein ligase A